MVERPSRIWKELPGDVRQAAAAAFWSDSSGDEAQMQQVEAILVIAKRLNFRPKSAQALPEERRAKLLAQMSDVSDAIATRALIAYHFQMQRPLMSAFLDALGLPHENGLISAESVAAPDAAAIAKATAALGGQFSGDAIRLYFRTLRALDSETWVNLPAD